MIDKFGSVIYTLPNLVNVILSKYNSKQEIERVRNFTIKNRDSLGISARAFEESIDNINTNKEWMDKNLNLILRWLTNDKLKSNLNEKDRSSINYKLPKNLKPISYNLFVQTFFDSYSTPEYYNASIRIAFTCIHETNELLLNMKNLLLVNDSLLLESLTDNSFTSKSKLFYSYSNDSHIFNVKINEYLKPGHNYSFYVEFKGFIKEDNIGFFKSSFYDSYFNKKWIMASQFEAIEARKAFICFDEPEFKALFNITVRHHPSLKAFSNMPIKETVKHSNYWIDTIFAESLPMSTYTLALVVSEFECLSAVVNNTLSKNLNISVCSRINTLNQVEYLFNVSLGLIDYYEKLFDVAFPLPKLDHVTVPDFNFGAMENFGLIIYK